MSDTTILAVDLSDLGRERFAGRAIDRPRASTTVEGELLEIRGWVVGEGSRPASVEVFEGERLLRSAPVALPRADVAQFFPDHPDSARSGFRMTLGMLGLPTEFELLVRVSFEGGGRVPLGSISGRRARLETGCEPRFAPVMLTALGRSGTTLAMHALAAAPEVVVDGGYPYERGFGRYWLHAAKLLSDPAEPGSRAAADFQQDQSRLPANPFTNGTIDPEAVTWIAAEQPRLIGELAQRAIDGYYASVARGAGRESATYFAEKMPPTHAQPVGAELYRAAREIFLVRDFRDVLCSIRAFNEQRGFQAFGRGEVNDEVAYVERLGGSARRLVESWRQRGEQALLLRYEDLVQDPAVALARVADHLGLPATSVEAMAAATAERSDRLSTHRTTASPAASIGRWRSDLPSELVQACEQALGSSLVEFGYEQGPAGAFGGSMRHSPDAGRAGAIGQADSLQEDLTQGPRP
jgi:hypothetical protein